MESANRKIDFAFAALRCRDFASFLNFAAAWTFGCTMPKEGIQVIDSSEEDAWEDEDTTRACPAALEIEHADAKTVAPNVRLYLVVSHLFSRCAEQVFQFVVIIFLTKAVLSEASLVLVSSYGLFSGLLVFALGSQFGRYLDVESARNRRLRSIRAVLIGQYGCVLVCTVACYALLTDEGHGGDETTSGGYPFDPLTTLLLVVIHLLGGFSLLFSEASTLQLKRIG